MDTPFEEEVEEGAEIACRFCDIICSLGPEVARRLF
jgi:hypothetical protein